MSETHCVECGSAFPIRQPGYVGGTGYATRPEDGERICYECCAKHDRETMIKHGKIALYLVKTGNKARNMGLDYHDVYEISNWPGTLKFKVQPGAVKPFRHPFSRDALIAYCVGPDGATWSAKNIGDNEIAHCRRIKG